MKKLLGKLSEKKSAKKVEKKKKADAPINEKSLGNKSMTMIAVAVVLAWAVAGALMFVPKDNAENKIVNKVKKSKSLADSDGQQVRYEDTKEWEMEKVKEATKYLQARKYRDGMVLLGKVLKKNQNNVTALVNLAHAYMKFGRYSKSRFLLLHALKNVQDNATVLNNLAMVEIKLDNYKEAQKYLEKAIALEGDKTTEIYLNMARVYEVNGQYNKAIEMYKAYTGSQIFDPSIISNVKQRIKELVLLAKIDQEGEI